MNWLINSWYKPSIIPWLLWPLSLVYCLIIRLRKVLYQRGIFTQHQLPVPVIIVGNISVGGTGKTPFVIWLAQQLKQAGHRPGIISRGYGGKAPHYPYRVTTKSIAKFAGDEPILIHRHSQCPMVVAPDRVAAARQLLLQNNCTVIIADDGLQHLALGRDIEIIIVDAQRQFANKQCLPSGPLREPLSRLKQCDFIVYNGNIDADKHSMQLNQLHAINLVDPTLNRTISSFKPHTIHAVAGIGNPDRFFDQLSSQGLDIISHPFDDHYQFTEQDFDFNDQHPTILMTEKDAVKCQDFPQKNMWYIPIKATIKGTLSQQIITQLNELSTHG